MNEGSMLTQPRSRLLSRLLSRRWQIIGGIGMIVVVLLTAGLVILRQRQFATQTSTHAGPAGVCGHATNVSASTGSIILPGVSLPETLSAGEPRIVATVNGDAPNAEDLEVRVAGAIANHRKALQQAPSGSLPLVFWRPCGRPRIRFATTRSRR
jgi:hypothetical protein